MLRFYTEPTSDPHAWFHRFEAVQPKAFQMNCMIIRECMAARCLRIGQGKELTGVFTYCMMEEAKLSAAKLSTAMLMRQLRKVT